MDKNEIAALEKRLSQAKSLMHDSEKLHEILKIWNQYVTTKDPGITGVKIQLERYYTNEEYNSVKGLRESIMVSDPKTIASIFDSLQKLQQSIDDIIAEL